MNGDHYANFTENYDPEYTNSDLHDNETNVDDIEDDSDYDVILERETKEFPDPPTSDTHCDALSMFHGLCSNERYATSVATSVVE